MSSTMSTQHPDNVTLPPWVKGEIIAGEDEVHEVYFAFKELQCKEHLLGKDFFITYRVPNPSVEAAEKKVLIEALASIINYLAGFVPSRRARKRHIGLFSYSRQVGKKQLPRAIKFTAAMYSLGIPPELVGANVFANLSEKQWKLLEKYYVHWKTDLSFAAEFLCWQNLNYLMGEKEIIKSVTEKFKLRKVIPQIMKDLETLEQIAGIQLGPKRLSHRKHANMVNNVLLSLAEGNEREIKNYIVEAGKIRHSLG